MLGPHVWCVFAGTHTLSRWQTHLPSLLNVWNNHVFYANTIVWLGLYFSAICIPLYVLFFFFLYIIILLPRPPSLKASPTFRVVLSKHTLSHKQAFVLEIKFQFLMKRGNASNRTHFIRCLVPFDWLHWSWSQGHWTWNYSESFSVKYIHTVVTYSVTTTIGTICCKHWIFIMFSNFLSSLKVMTFKKTHIHCDPLKNISSDLQTEGWLISSFFASKVSRDFQMYLPHETPFGKASLETVLCETVNSGVLSHSDLEWRPWLHFGMQYSSTVQLYLLYSFMILTFCCVHI